MKEEKNRIPCICTLPLLPPVGQIYLEKVVAPVITSFIGNKTKTKYIVALNLLGPRMFNKNVIEKEFLVQKYLNALTDLKVEADIIWRDDKVNGLLITKFITKLVSLGHITSSIKEIERCDCGIVEMLYGVSDEKSNRSLFEARADGRFCQVCKGKVKKHKEEVLLFKLPEVSKDIKAHPRFFEKELKQMALKYSGKHFLISKNRKTAIRFVFNGKEYGLDVDFVWQLYLVDLYEKGFLPQVVVASSHNLMPYLFVLSLYKILIGRKILFVVHPLFFSDKHQRLLGERFALSKLISKFGAKSIRVWLASNINWNRKSSSLNIRELSLLSKMDYRIHSSENNFATFESAISSINGQDLKKSLSLARRKKGDYYDINFSGVV